MRVEQGREAVWQHINEMGMAEDIKKIAQYFDIADISVIGGGKMTFLKEKPRKMVRVPAIPTKIDFKSVIDNSREKRKRFK